MTNRIKIILFTLLFATGFSFQHCSICDCNDVQPYFDVHGITIYHIDDNNNYNLDTLDFANYRTLGIEYDVTYITQLIPTNYSFMNSAMACSCDEPGSAGSKNEVLKSIKIITINYYDELHKANSLINDIITLDDNNREYINKYISENENYIGKQQLDLRLDKAPSSSTVFQVKVIIELSTGEVYNSLSQEILLNL